MTNKTKPASIIVAMTHDGGIGKDGQLPWPKIPADMKRFREITETVSDPSLLNAVVMGRKTFDSLPSLAKPLKNRLNVVISSTTTLNDYPNGVLVFSSLSSAVASLNTDPAVENIFFIGGEKIYQGAVKEGLCTRAFITRIGCKDEWNCDARFQIGRASCRERV